MPVLKIILDGEGSGKPLAETHEELLNHLSTGKIIHLGENALMEVSALDEGMVSGKASIMLRLELPDGRTVLAQTSLALWLTAAKLFATRYPEQAKEVLY